MIFQFLGTVVLITGIFFVGKLIFWKDIQEIVWLNQEVALGNPEPEKLVRVYRALLKKFSILIVFFAWRTSSDEKTGNRQPIITRCKNALFVLN